MAQTMLRNYVTALVAKSEPSDAHDFWSTIFCAQLTFEEIAEVLSFPEVRKLRDKQPKSFAMLTIKSVEQVHLFSRYTGTFFTPMLNALRILTRIVPIAFEDSSFTENLFWKNKIIDKTGKEVIYNHLGSEELTTSLGEVLMISLLNATAHGRFCFIPSANIMALPEQLPQFKFVNPRILWTGGIGIPENGNTRDGAIDANRIDLLRCFLACISEPLYRSNVLGLNKFARAMCGTPNPINVSFCYSLFNVVFSYDPSGALPYTSYWTDAQEEVVDMALQLLVGASDYYPLLNVNTEKVTPNAFWYAIEHLQQPYDVAFVVHGVKMLLGNRIRAANTWLPGSQKELNCHGVLLLLLVKLLQRNPSLTQGLLRGIEITELMSMLLYIMYEDTESKRGIIKPATCLLLQLSQDDSFCRVLNVPFTGKLPSGLPTTEGTHGDLLVMVLHYIMNLNQDWLKPLYEQFLTILHNISPHCALRSLPAAARLMQLLNIFSNPMVLENEPELAALIVPTMEVIRNLLLFDYNGNLVVLYAVLREAAIFQRIADMMHPPDDDEDEEEEEDDDKIYLSPDIASRVPIDLPLRLINSLAPKLNEFCYGGKSYTEAEILQFLNRVRIANMPEPEPFQPKEFNSFDKISDLIARWTWNSIFVSNLNPPVWDSEQIRSFRLTKIQSLEPQPPPTSTALTIGPTNQLTLSGKAPLALPPPVNDGKPGSILKIAIRKLIEIPVSENDENFWRVVFLPGGSGLSFEEVCKAITIAEARELRWRQPVSMANLILKCIQRLELCAINPQINEYTAVGNILRILTRALPAAFETELPGSVQMSKSEVADNDFATNLFWNSKIKGADGETYEVASSDGELWGRKMMKTLAQLSCRPGLTFIPSSSSATLPEGVLGHKHLNPRLLWCGGIAVYDGDLGNSRNSEVDAHSIDIMRCLLACFTETLYNSNPLEANRFIGAFTNYPNPFNVTLLYSLLNITLSYDPSGSLPYTSYWTDTREEVVAYAVQVMLAVMNYGFFQGDNVWWTTVEEMKAKRDLAFVSGGMLRLISNRYKAANTWLPLSQKELDFHAPLLLLLLKLLERNSDLREVMALAVDMDELMISLLFVMFNDTIDKRGLLKPVTCILLFLSTHPSFCKMLSKPFTGTLPVNLPKFQGNLADLLVVVLHYIINLNEEWIKPIYEQFFAVLFNISPHCSLASVIGSAKLVALVDVFSGIKVLSRSPEYADCVVRGIEIINNFLSFDYAGNRTLLYIVLREKAVFERIQEMTQPGGKLQPYKDELPLEMIQRLIATLGPRLEEYCKSNHSTTDEDVMNFLSRIKLTNLPTVEVPKPRYPTRLEAAVTQWVWATIFGRNTQPQIWAVGPIKLIQVATPASQLAITGPSGPETPAALLASAPASNTRVRRAFDILTSQVVDVNDTDFWRSLFTQPFTFEELTSSVPLPVVRHLKGHQPVSFATIIYKSVEQAHLFGKYSGDFYVPVCNALRLLTRLMPILYEQAPGEPDFAANLLWKNKVVSSDGTEVGVQTKNWTEEVDGPERSLGQILANALLHAALHPGFVFIPTATTQTLPEKASEKSFSSPRHIWTGGLGVSDTGNYRDATVDANRIELLRCIIACTSSTLYEVDPLRRNAFVEAMVGELHMFNVTFCYSLLNTVFAYDPQGSAPYLSYWTDSQEEVVDKSLQVLLALLHPGDANSTNAFWYVLTKISNDHDMAVAVQGCLNFLSNRKNAANTWIPGSQKDLDCQGFITLLLLKLLQANPSLRDRLCKVVAIKDIISSSIFIMIEDFQLKRGYMGAVTLLIFMLSEEINFGRVLNLPAEKLPTNLPLQGGSWFDTLVVVTHHMASSDIEWISKLAHRMLSSLYHASPSTENISVDASVRLIQLFGVYSRQLLGGDLECAPLVDLVLKIITNLLTHHFSSNLQLVVSMLFTSHLTERLENLVGGTGEGADVPPKVRQSLQASVPIRVLKSFEPLFEQHIKAHGSPDRDVMLATLKQVNLTGMPEPPPMFIDSPETPEEKDRRITKFAWYCIFTHNISPALWEPSSIKVITVITKDN